MNRVALLLLVLAGCPRHGDKSKPSQGSGGWLTPPTKGSDAGTVALPAPPPVPTPPAGLPAVPANPRITPAAVALGAELFSDPKLSPKNDRSCATCHQPEHDFAGGVETAADGKQNLRRTPTLANLAWVTAFGWDGRYSSVAALLPPHIKGQLGDPSESVAARLAEDPRYAAQFARVGGTPRDAMLQALEAFVLTRYDGDSPWDRSERSALSRPGSAAGDPVLAGYQLFMGKAQCGRCHPPPLYTDNGFHVVVDAAGDPGHQGAFRTPTVRGAANRIAFFHRGTKASLADVVRYYGSGGDGATAIDEIVLKIRLDASEQEELLAFLRALSAPRPPQPAVTPAP